MNDLMDQLAQADPLRGRPAPDTSVERLVRIRARVDTAIAQASAASAHIESLGADEARSGHRVGVAGASRRPATTRRWLALGAAAAALAVAGTAALSLVEPGEGPSLAVTSVALTEEGRLACTPPVGYSEPIDPADAVVTMLPTWLPDGWQVGHVWAVRETSPTCFSNPSLVLADTEADGAVTRSALVYGPIDEPISVEGRDGVEVPIAGTTGQLFRTSTNDKFDQQWLWTDEQGGNWLLRAYGYSEERGEQLAEALRVDGDRIGVDRNAAPDGTDVVFQRTGEPYPAWTEQTRTSVSLGHGPMTGQDAEVLLEVVATSTPDTFGIDLVVPGEQRIVRTDEGVRVDTEMLGIFSGAVVAPGTLVYLMDTTAGSMGSDDRRRVVAGLETVRPDDPRLDARTLR